MRNLNNELEALGLPGHQITHVLQWVNTLTNQDLKDNGNDNWLCGPPGNGDVDPDVPVGYESWESYYSLDSRINRWVQENINTYRPQESGRLNFIRDMRKEFSITLVECKSYLDKNW